MTMATVFDKMEGAGYIVRGPRTLTETEEVLEKVGDRDYYKRQIR